MLAVQQPQQLPRMASDRSPPEGDDSFLPFGYNFDPNQEPPMEPPEPPTGAPLLTETDSKFLSSFFDDITADQYNMPSFGEGLNFSDAWLDLPPQFMGSATSFGQQAGTPMASSSSTPGMPYDPMSLFGGLPQSFMMPPPPPPPQQLQQHYQHQSPNQNQNQNQNHNHNHNHNQHQPQYHQQHHHHQHQNQHNQHQHQQSHQQPQAQPQHHQHLQQQQQQQSPHTSHSQQQHTDDVLNAAATLVHSPNQSSHSGNQSAGEPDMTRRTMGPPVGHLRHQALEEFHGAGQQATSKGTKQENVLADWMMAPEGRKVSRRSLSTDFQWGSDPNFNTTQGYTPDANRETVESMHREQLKLLDSLEVSKSTGNTRASSPHYTQDQPATNQQRSSPPARKTSKPAKAPEDPDAPPRKRRKSRVNRAGEEDEGDDKEASAVKPKGRRKSKVEKSGDVSPPPAESGSAKKRRGTVNGAKAPRENLSEEQKRENHIRSEQKRRTLIKEGFDDLCELVPALNGGGFSKSTMLSIAAEYLEEILRGNQVLADQMASLNGSR